MIKLINQSNSLVVDWEHKGTNVTYYINTIVNTKPGSCLSIAQPAIWSIDHEKLADALIRESGLRISKRNRRELVSELNKTVPTTLTSN